MFGVTLQMGPSDLCRHPGDPSQWATMRGGSSVARARRTAIVALLVAWNLLLTVAVIAEALIGSRGATFCCQGP